MSQPVSRSHPIDRDPVVPRGFHRGAATSAYQIGEAVAEDGYMPLIRGSFGHQLVNVHNKEIGDVGRYHRTDVALRDYPSQRLPKTSTWWYRQITAHNTPGAQ